MKKFIFIFLLLNQFAFANFNMNKNMQKAYYHIVNLEFEKALILLEIEEYQNPNNGFILSHKNYIDFLTILITEDYDYFVSRESLKNIRLDMLDNNDKTSPYYLYLKAEVNLQWAISRLKFKQYPTAAYELVKAYKLLEENQIKFPEFTLNNKCLGLIHVLLASVPNDFHWILNLIGLKGNFDIGIREIDIVLNDDRFLMYKSEALFLLSFLQINLGNDDSLCQKYLDMIGDNYKYNVLLNFAAARLSHNLGKNDYCLSILKNRPNNTRSIHFHYLDYLQGMSYLYKLDFKNANQKFDSFVKNFNGKNYLKSANHKLAWIAFLQDNIEMKRKYFSRVLSKGDIAIDEDKIALKEAKIDYISHPILLKTRLLYDGGYYHKALIEIEQIDISLFSNNTENVIEYWYRLARVKSKLDDSDEVIEYYKKALKKGKNSSSYYAPMSALQLGFIYQRNGNNLQSRFYFNKCLSMSGFDYQRGIHQKAKFALERVKD